MSLGKRALEDEEEEDKETRLFGTGKLHRSEVERYSRQIMLPEVTSTGARALLDAKVLVVGAGGLGSSILLYLAAAGVGHIGVVDFDTVDRSNLHRQVAHADDRVGVNKAVSAAQACLALNPTVHVEAIQEQFTELNGQALVNRFDVVIDATDNVAARYLVNDACALAEGGRRPLVSGSAMRWEGQLTVYNYEDGPCFRCVFPTPPPAATVGSCNDVGVIGAVPGTIGCMQALEAQKILIPGAAAEGGVLSGRMLFWDGLRGTFRVMKLRPRSATCVVCGTAVDDEHRIKTITSVGTVYEAGACARPPQAGLDPRHRIAAKDAVPIVRAAVPTTVIIDVRESLQYNMCALPRSVPLPLADLDAAAKKATCAADGALALVASRLPSALPSGAELLVLCRRGIASVKATRLLVEEAAKFDAIADDGRVKLPGTDSVVLRLRNIDGGLNGLTSAGLHEFPVY